MSLTRAQSAWRQPMFWLVVGLPLVSIAMSTTYAVIAFRVFDGVVVDDYYKRGRAINRVLRRDRAAEDAGMTAVVELDPESGNVDLALSAREVGSLPAAATLHFLHATRAVVDRLAELRRGVDGRYRATIAGLAPGKYHVQLETENWRLVGLLRSPAESSCALLPAL